MVISKTAEKNILFCIQRCQKEKQDKFTAGQLDAATFANCRNTNRSLLEWQGPGPDASS